MAGIHGQDPCSSHAPRYDGECMDCMLPSPKIGLKPRQDVIFTSYWRGDPDHKLSPYSNMAAAKIRFDAALYEQTMRGDVCPSETFFTNAVYRAAGLIAEYWVEALDRQQFFDRSASSTDRQEVAEMMDAIRCIDWERAINAAFTEGSA